MHSTVEVQAGGRLPSGVTPAVVCAGAVWGFLVATAVVLQRFGIAEPPTCLFRHLTGTPCATCGGTRATFALLQGDLWTALTFNPGVTLLLVAIPVWILWAMLRRGRPSAPLLSGWAAAAVVLAAVAANWAYVLWRGV